MSSKNIPFGTYLTKENVEALKGKTFLVSSGIYEPLIRLVHARSKVEILSDKGVWGASLYTRTELLQYIVEARGHHTLIEVIE